MLIPYHLPSLCQFIYISKSLMGKNVLNVLKYKKKYGAILCLNYYNNLFFNIKGFMIYEYQNE